MGAALMSSLDLLHAHIHTMLNTRVRSHRPARRASASICLYTQTGTDRLREREHAIGAKRLQDQEKVRDWNRSAPLIISYRALSSILNDKSSAHAKINLTTNTKNSVFNVLRICSPVRADLCEQTLTKLRFHVCVQLSLTYS
ncbi:hypothetical protein B5X24_HaOG202462 [Helicoverpa armigera]|uniref:Uncharacterized protein n=1 Tax=Helicoverpa armigera TaxID=29058 RepID=A0A2W1BV22_HELAM|nr:hypothetical protein B5X24_HaOG202462 [Helicoverpa armigera]